MDKTENRNFINFLRGVAIFLMIWGHCIQSMCNNQFDFFENPVFKTIYSFHMPFFMLISGYLFCFSSQKRDLTELINYRVKSMLYPMLMYSIINYVITDGVWLLISGRYYALFYQNSLYDFWFLWAVLSSSFAVAIAIKTTDKTYIHALLLILGFFIVAFFPNRRSNVYMYPYFVIGYLFADNEEKLEPKFNILGIISLVLFILMLFFYKKEHYIYMTGFISNNITENIDIALFRWSIGLFGSIAVIFVFRLMKPIISCKNAIIKGIEFLGSNSLAIYLLSCTFLSYWLPSFTHKALTIFPQINWNTHIILYDFVITPLIAVLYSVLLSLIVILIKKANLYKIIFGR